MILCKFAVNFLFKPPGKLKYDLMLHNSSYFQCTVISLLTFLRLEHWELQCADVVWMLHNGVFPE